MRPAAALAIGIALVVLTPPRSAHGQPADAGQSQERPATAPQPHGTHRHGGDTPQPDEAQPPTTEPTTPIPPITEGDRAAAFPEVEPHRMRDDDIHSFILLDQLEWQGGDPANGGKWGAKGWIGQDRDRLWFRTEGHTDDGRLEDAELHLFYGRAVSRWWELVAGVRQDFRPGPLQTWAAFGVQGLAPYWFDVEATGYFSDRGQTALRLEVEYELLLTNRLVLKPLVEIDLYGKSNPERKIGAGLSETDLGLRLRYELRRELAPYVGLSWHNSFGETRDLARAAGDAASGLRFVVGVRAWY